MGDRALVFQSSARAVASSCSTQRRDMTAIVELEQLLRSMQPALNPGRYVFASVPAGKPVQLSQVVASIREPEGLSVVVESEVAVQLGLSLLFECAWITLTVHSDLSAVGLTAAFADALGRAGISCNVVAGAFHDHVFVPEHQADAAMAALRGLQQQARSNPQRKTGPAKSKHTT
jgi:hypothetical protein